jgi:hypothetical protein
MRPFVVRAAPQWISFDHRQADAEFSDRQQTLRTRFPGSKLGVTVPALPEKHRRRRVAEVWRTLSPAIGRLFICIDNHPSKLRSIGA